MARSVVTVPLSLGRRDRFDAKIAPLGVVERATNLRVRKDGRLGMRHGYEALDMTTRNGELVAFDLHEYRGRLVALGSDAGDGFPTDLFEFTGLASDPWLGRDPVNRRVTLNPFTNLRDVAGIPQPEEGVEMVDAAAGGGYVCLVYQPSGSGRLYALIVDASNDQTVHHAPVSVGITSGESSFLRVVYSGGTFYLAAVSPVNAITIGSFTVGVDTSFTVFRVVSTSDTDDVTAMDLCAVTNGSTARIAIAYDKGAAEDLSILVYAADGSQVGSTITVAGTNAVHLSLEADQARGTINLFTIETATDGRLRTFSFAGSLLVGPTTTASGTSGSICRLPAAGSFVESIAVAVNQSDSNVAVRCFSLAAHVAGASHTVSRAVLKSRLVSAASPAEVHAPAVAFSGLVGGDLSTFDKATNALFYVLCASSTSARVGHLVTRDLSAAKTTGFVNLSVDSTTGKICWVSCYDPGVAGSGMPSATLLDLHSTERRQSAAYGGLLYFAGATAAVYDGRLPTEVGFNEIPAIVSATPGSGGSLVSEATYTYTVHWEYVLADGSVVYSPVSEPLDVTLGASDTRVTVVTTTPHSLRCALAEGLTGGDVVAVLSRNQWDADTGQPFSTQRRCMTRTIARAYGATIQFTDDTSDDAISTAEALYTQGERGALSAQLEHNAPRSCTFITATEARLITGGLARSFEYQISKAAFRGEPISFSEFSAFFGLAPAPIVGVRRLDSARLIFTADAVLAVHGDGPDDVGGGELGPPVELPSPGGLESAWSFLEGPDGLWFQLDDSKIYRIPRGAGAPEWAGIDVQDTLDEYPVISGTAKHKRDGVGLFACNNTARDAGVFVGIDFRTQTWLEDTPPVGEGGDIEALCSFGDSVAYVAGGTVYVQSTSSFVDAGNQFITTTLRSRPLYPFGLGGYGQICQMLFTGEFRGGCVLEARVSYDDGLNWTSLTSFTITTGYTPGQTIQRKWTLPQDVTSSLVVEFTVTGTTPTSPSEGLVFNQLDLLVEAESGLRELPQAEQA